MIWLVLSLIVLIGAAEYYSLHKLPGFLSAESRLLSKTTPKSPSYTHSTLLPL